MQRQRRVVYAWRFVHSAEMKNFGCPLQKARGAFGSSSGRAVAMRRYSNRNRGELFMRGALTLNLGGAGEVVRRQRRAVHVPWLKRLPTIPFPPSVST